MPLVLFEEEWHERIDAVDDPAQVDVEYPVPDRFGRTDRQAASDAGVVEHHVGRAELSECRVAHGYHVRFLRDIALDPNHLRTVVPQRRHRFLERLILDVAQYEVRPRRRKPLRGGEADAA